MVLAIFAGAAVVFRQEIDQQLAVLGVVALEPDRERHLARLGVEIVHEQDRIVAPVVAHHQHGGVAGRDHGEIAPAHLGDFLAHADDPLGPVERRVRMAPLDRGIDVLVAVRSSRDDGQVRLVTLGEAAMRFVRPLHRRARAVALGELEVVAHTELVAVAHDRCTGQREHQAVGELQTPAIALQHGGEAAANAALIKLHLGFGCEGGKHLLPLPFAKSAEIELVVIAQEHAPLRRCWARLGCLHRLDQRPCVGCCQCVEQVLIDLKVEHHVHSVALGA